MVKNNQVKLADELWAQSKASAQLAYDSWRLLAQSQKTLLDSYRAVGFPFSEATKQFEKFMEAHSEAFKAALEHLEKTEQAHREVLRKFNQPSA